MLSHLFNYKEKKLLSFSQDFFLLFLIISLYECLCGPVSPYLSALPNFKEIAWQ